VVARIELPRRAANATGNLCVTNFTNFYTIRYRANETKVSRSRTLPVRVFILPRTLTAERSGAAEYSSPERTEVEGWRKGRSVLDGSKHKGGGQSSSHPGHHPAPRTAQCQHRMYVS